MLKTFIHKSRSAGLAFSCVAPSKPVLKLHHLLFYLPVLPQGSGRQFDFAVLVGQVALVCYLEKPGCEVCEPNYVPVIHKRASDVIDLSAAVFTARIGQEEDGLVVGAMRGEVDQIPLRVLPDSVEFSFDEHSGGFPDGPAYQLFSTLSDHMLWNDAEAFAQWLAGQRLMRDDYGHLALNHMGAEVLHV